MQYQQLQVAWINLGVYFVGPRSLRKKKQIAFKEVLANKGEKELQREAPEGGKWLPRYRSRRQHRERSEPQRPTCDPIQSPCCNQDLSKKLKEEESNRRMCFSQISDISLPRSRTAFSIASPRSNELTIWHGGIRSVPFPTKAANEIFAQLNWTPTHMEDDCFDEHGLSRILLEHHTVHNVVVNNVCSSNLLDRPVPPTCPPFLL